ncbi:phage integrase SAM-like domain-containing protein [Elizabethkingia anophelis]|nr:phage integrase SAM-like domain-containing protein [Elizabethkingia anophelis]MCT3635472.1 phage integrase SAM-like domain-containing protein [Elizabethkingia anophelis]MCT3832171.1 phage integrase SAM-like domain-containing protein [Elizabethkingia anophelis]MCT3885677.1 phage integrase SAM-like domain-containing protein [Elizabethkingia anophelis]MCT3896443.1 phage integrase SAM-like domain-containing protein [Elizabethkingia anophelis]
MSASVKTVCKKNALKDGLFPIYLRVTINRKSKFYSTPFSCKLIEWNDDTGEFNAKFRNNIVFNKTLRKIKDNASDVIDLLQKEYDTYNLVLFDKYYSKNENKDLTFSLLLEKEVQVLEENGQVSYGNSINDTYSALKKFKSNIKEYKFENIDYQFLADFENFLRKGGAEDGGISVYMRNIRMLYNKAINYKIVQSQYYPFKEFKISKYKKKKIKRALSEKEFQQILNLDVNEIPSARNARYLYIFSYYARGMNFTDLAELKWTDIESGKFNYTRNKTSVNLKIKLPDKPIITEIFDFYKLYRLYVFKLNWTFYNKSLRSI